ncbi:hypothetical protein ONS96_001406 [Cadophora gregata f. sp. sojae]|nr:hypothetical protein ONS96_001406 [Cadophora gregata f. sp. sojae]
MDESRPLTCALSRGSKNNATHNSIIFPRAGSVYISIHHYPKLLPVQIKATFRAGSNFILTHRHLRRRKANPHHVDKDLGGLQSSQNLQSQPNSCQSWRKSSWNRSSSDEASDKNTMTSRGSTINTTMGGQTDADGQSRKSNTENTSRRNSFSESLKKLKNRRKSIFESLKKATKKVLGRNPVPKIDSYIQRPQGDSLYGIQPQFVNWHGPGNIPDIPQQFANGQQPHSGGLILFARNTSRVTMPTHLSSEIRH